MPNDKSKSSEKHVEERTHHQDHNNMETKSTFSRKLNTHESHEHHEHHEPAEQGGQDHGSHHAHMVADFRKRFWISIILTAPILILSPMIQRFIGIGESIRFTGDLYVLFALSSVVFF